MKPSDLAKVLAATIKAKAPVLITGAPGIGKTDVVAQASVAAGAELIVECAALSDPIDAKGAIMLVDGRANFQPVGNLWRLVEATKLTVFDIEDVGQAAPLTQAGYMNLILGRRVGEYPVSPFVTFVATTNRRTDRAGVGGLLEPVKSRFATIVDLEPDVDDWVRWALTAGVPTELIAYIRFRPEMLHKFAPTADLVNTPSPRTVANVGRLMGMGIPAELEFEVFSGAAGSAFASELVGFLQIFRNLPNPDMILLNPDAAEVPGDPATLYALCGALVRRANDNTIDRLVKYFNRMPAEFSVVAMASSITRDPALKDTRAYIDWTIKNQDVTI